MKPIAGTAWLTAAEIATLGLPGIPKSARAVREWIAAEGWAERFSADGKPLARARRSRGGGIEYHASLLPAEAQHRVLRPDPIVPAPSNDTLGDDNELWERFDQLPASAKSEASRRMSILADVDALVSAGSTKTAAVASVALSSHVSVRTIENWLAAVRNVQPTNWLPRLAPQYKGGGKPIEIDPDAWQALASEYHRTAKPAFAESYNRLVEEYARPRGITLPSPKTLKRRLDRETSPLVAVARREGREALRRMTPPLKRSIADLHAMEAVNIDGHQFDVFVQFEDGSIGRPILIGIQDLYSRKLLAYRIGRTENTSLARLAFADLFREWGIPVRVVVDNGRAFASRALSGGSKTRFRFRLQDDEAAGVLTQVGVKMHWTLPYRGSSKPIERAWRDLCGQIAKHPAMDGAYTGNKPDAKPENAGSRAIPIEEFRQRVARGIAFHNARSGRRTEAAAGRSFDETFAASYAVHPIGRATDAHLRLALLEAQERRCHRQHGSITLMGNDYWSEDLLHLRGQKVIVRFDPENLHSDLHVYRKDGAYVCAAPVRNRTGFFDQESAKERAKAEAKLNRLARLHAEQQGLIDAADLARLLDGSPDPAPRPAPGATRIIRHRGQTVAALKAHPQAQTEPASPSFIDNALAGKAMHLRSVE